MLISLNGADVNPEVTATSKTTPKKGDSQRESLATVLIKPLQDSANYGSTGRGSTGYQVTIEAIQQPRSTPHQELQIELGTDKEI